MKQMISDFFLLPYEIATDIFSRLPVDSILQCKLVCKIWRDLISDPAFIDLHTENSSNNSITEKRSFLLQVTSSPNRSFHFREYNDDKEVASSYLTKLLPLFTRHRLFEDAVNWLIVGSCNGLICLRRNSTQKNTVSDDLYVCNPFSGEYAKLQKSNHPIKLGRKYMHDIAHGFGYHPRTKQYKVVRIYYPDPGVSQGHVEVYTLGSGAWRSIGVIEHSRMRKLGHPFGNSHGILLNGALYWLKMGYKELISFDLEHEKFRVIPGPAPQVFPELQLQQQQLFWDLEVLRGCLFMTTADNQTSVIWAMNNEYCWTKKFSIRNSFPCFPFAFLESGLILLQGRFKWIVSYDPKSESLVKIINLEQFEIIPYTKSFVSLKALGLKRVQRKQRRKRRRSGSLMEQQQQQQQQW